MENNDFKLKTVGFIWNLILEFDEFEKEDSDWFKHYLKRGVKLDA